MPPKAKKNEPSKKTEQKQKAKVLEDKTFGLKNKKGTKQQKFIKTVAHQVQHGDQKSAKAAKEAEQKGKKQLDKAARQAELNMLFKPVEQKVAKGVDPKSVVCAFFKEGLCGKGAKCKFSHDLNIERKGEKRSIYADTEANAEGMEEWDEEKLAEVVNKKHGETNKSLPTTSIICKFFLEAVELNKYGWFWRCPNGEKCHYRHALPPGFILKRDVKKGDKEDSITLEELIEKERAALNSQNLTKVTLETFMKWKERKRQEKIAKLKEASDKKKSNFKEGKVFGISGREMFEFNPELVVGDDDEADDIVYSKQPEEDDGDVRDITLESLSSNQYVTAAPTVRPPMETTATTDDASQANAEETSKLAEASAIPTDPKSKTDEAIAAAMSAVNGLELAGDATIDFDENLFDGDDIDLVEDELDELDLETLE